AIGLRVRHINFESGLLEISEAFARTVKGPNHAARIQKGTKTDNIRYLPMTVEWKELFVPQIHGKNPDDLILPSPQNL
ncbi:hypothetical protein, partial [Chitinophaga sp. GbtcB8]|uniref:hypothetical protein n=1 Tax=Chitinophaga sp. GbtcB8 TaxID=2824753 RepID=UPI001C2F3373